MNTDQLFTRQPRWFEIVIGMMAALIGLVLSASFMLLIYDAYTRPGANPSLITLSVMAVLAFFFCSVAIRLLAGWARRDGGLLSPLTLRLGGLLLLVTPVVALFAPEPQLMNIVVSITAGIACFVLANRRSEKKLDGDSHAAGE